jgi:segregation and condensation protein B
MTAPSSAARLEAVLLVTDEPVPAVTLAGVVEQPVADVEAALSGLAAEYTAAGRGFDLRQVAGGWRLYTRAECAPWVERFVLDGQSARLTQAALETLAVIAYRQPVTRARISAVRGVNVDGVVRTLLARGLISEAGQDTSTAGTLYRTTPLLLEKLGLQSLEELPDLAPMLPDLDELDDTQDTRTE